MLSPARVRVAGTWTRENAAGAEVVRPGDGLVRCGLGLVLGLRGGLGRGDRLGRGDGLAVVGLGDGDGHAPAPTPEPVGDGDAVDLAGWPAAALACADKATRASAGARTTTAQTDRRPALIWHRPLNGHRSRRPRWKQDQGRC